MIGPLPAIFRLRSLLPTAVWLGVCGGPIAPASGQGAAPLPASPAVRIASTPVQTNVMAAERDPFDRTRPGALQRQPCVLLNNDHVLFGTARPWGQHVVVQTGPQAEVKLLRTEVACWGDSLLELYQYRLDHRLVVDAEAHLRDARWCLQYDLIEQAEDQIRAAAALQPSHPGLPWLRRQLELRQRAVAGTLAEPPAIAVARFDQPLPRPLDDSEAPTEADPQRLAHFAGQVQPLLINRCGRCHHQHSARHWRITIPTAGSRPSARMTRSNLAATLPFVDAERPLQSELLSMATTAHGEAPAPLGTRNRRALEALQAWLGQMSAVANPAERIQGAELAPADDGATGAAAEEVFDKPASSLRAGEPQRLPAVANPLDPDLFNRRYHGVQQ